MWVVLEVFCGKDVGETHSLSSGIIGLGIGIERFSAIEEGADYSTEPLGQTVIVIMILSGDPTGVSVAVALGRSVLVLAVQVSLKTERSMSRIRSSYFA